MDNKVFDTWTELSEIVNDGNGLEARADTASCILEYAYWKKG